MTTSPDDKSKYFDPLARLVAAGESVAAACGAVGCANSTGYRIAATSDFKTEVNRLRSEFVREATGKLGRACSDAVDTIIDLMKNTADPRVKLRAAAAVLDRFAKLSDNLELRERIDALEAKSSE